MDKKSQVTPQGRLTCTSCCSKDIRQKKLAERHYICSCHPRIRKGEEHFQRAVKWTEEMLSEHLLKECPIVISPAPREWRRNWALHSLSGSSEKSHIGPLAPKIPLPLPKLHSLLRGPPECAKTQRGAKAHTPTGFPQLARLQGCSLHVSNMLLQSPGSA